MKLMRLTRILRDSVNYSESHTLNSQLIKASSVDTYSKYAQIVEHKDESLELSASFEEVDKLN